MKILLYSDVHISKTSSILPLNFLSSKFSFRQNMIIETGKYLANLADEYKVDMIINLGDTFDVHTVTSYDIVTASEFFKCFRYLSVPHLVIVGNHEMINSDFNAVEILSNIDNITVIDEPCRTGVSTLLKADGSEPINLAFLPYCNYKDIIEFPEGDFLFSHQDIQGSVIRGVTTLTDGIATDALKQYKLVFNGHIHKPSIMGNVVNVGSVTTHSFADDELAVPQCYIFDTTNLNLTTFKPTICPLFRKLEINNTQELLSKLSNLDKNYKYIINCVCPFDIKEDVKQILINSDVVLNHRINTKVDANEDRDKKDNMILQQSNLDIKKAFKEFLNTVELKYPKELYLNIIEEVNNNVKE